MNATGLKVDAIEAVAAGHSGARGLSQLRESLALSTAAPSRPTNQ